MTPRTSTTKRSWRPLGAVSPADLAGARLELHWALQAAAAVGISRAAPAADWAHHSLAWSGRHGALIGARVDGPGRPYRAGLRLARPALLLVDPDETVLDEHPLAGRTLDEAFAWLEGASERITGSPGRPLERPENELPDHPVARGGRFGPGCPAHAELARWYGDLAGTLKRLRSGRKASPVRLWSHHFDLDTVLDLGSGHTRGLGFSPGDEGIAEPYLYVLPDPAPEPEALPALEAPFAWSTEGWVGVVLRGSRLAEATAAEQPRLAERFFASALAALRTSRA